MVFYGSDGTLPATSGVTDRRSIVAHPLDTLERVALHIVEQGRNDSGRYELRGRRIVDAEALVEAAAPPRPRARRRIDSDRWARIREAVRLCREAPENEERVRPRRRRRS
jgi:hypothetical protein